MSDVYVYTCFLEKQLTICLNVLSSLVTVIEKNTKLFFGDFYTCFTMKTRGFDVLFPFTRA